LLQQAIGRVERGESDGIIVAYLSRFGRSLVDALRHIEQITEAGGTFVSVQEGLDFSTDAGRLVLRMLFSIAEWERDRIRSNWANARERAVARGVCMSHRSFGYQRAANGRLRPDPVEGPLVSEIFDRRAAGASIAELRAFMDASGVPTARSNERWGAMSIWNLLRSRRYLGELRHGEYINTEAHPPLTDAGTWRLAQHDNLRVPTKRAAEVQVLAGILRCAGCQRVMQTSNAHPRTSMESRVYRCVDLRVAGSCPAPAQIIDSFVEPYVEAIFWQELPRVARSGNATRLKRLEAEVARRERDLANYRDNTTVLNRLGADRFADGLEIRVGRLERAQVELSRAHFQATGPKLQDIPELRANWPTMTLEDRRAAIWQVIEAAFVSPGRRKVADRLFVCLRGKAPRDLPPPNPRQPIETRPFDPATCPPSPALRDDGPHWSQGELLNALSPFLAGRDQWPSFRQFQAAGLGLLHMQVERHGGPRHIAFVANLPFAPREKMQGYTEERVGTELRDYLADRSSWPTVKQFTADHRSKLRLAVGWYGGQERWAKEMGVVLGRAQKKRQRWSYDRLKDEVAQFTAGRVQWPSQVEFRTAGLQSVYDTIAKYGVRERLAAELGLYLPAGIVGNNPRWNEAAVRATLDPFLEGRRTWPSVREFKTAGLSALRQSISTPLARRDAWARHYRLTPPVMPDSFTRRTD
jgi:DNA invertase Pin-like site-specific DNA recombinase